MPCGQPYAYDDRRCVLGAGHEDEDHHVSEDGFHWLHHEEELTEDYTEVWDEPIDRLNRER